MSIKTWSIIDPIKNECNLVLSASEEVAQLNTPTGYIYVEGGYDRNLHEIIDGKIAERASPYVDPLVPSEDYFIKHKRNSLLASSDWTQVPDAPVDQAAWQVYRQALRDITEQEGFPLNIIWPQPPQ